MTHQRKRDRDAVAGLLLLPREENEDWNEAIHSALAILDAPRTYDPNCECCAGDGLQGDGETPCPCGTLPAPMPASAAEPVVMGYDEGGTDRSALSIGEVLGDGTITVLASLYGSDADAVMALLEQRTPPPSAAPTDNTALLERWVKVVEEQGLIGSLLEESRAALASRPAARAEGDVGAWRQAIADTLNWDAKRGYPLPYRIRDPLVAALRPQSSAQGGEA